MTIRRSMSALLALLIVLTLDSPAFVHSTFSTSTRTSNVDQLIDSVIDKTSYDESEAPSTVSLLPQPLCPPPSFLSGGICIITANFSVDRTLVLASNTTLDCQGHSLRPRLGTLTSASNTRPQIGIFLNRVRNVVIKRCHLTGFDFGIFAINSKGGPATMHSFELTQSSILARYAGVSLFSVDKARLFQNTIVHTRAGGRGLYVGRNSDQNVITHNRFVARLTSSIVRAFRVPGFASISANPQMITPGAAVIITDVERNEPALLNAVINSQLFQLTSRTDITESTPSSESNRFENNILIFGSTPIDGIVLDLAIDTRVADNKIHAPGGIGIQERLQNNLPRELPGRCALEPSRLCMADDGCQLLGFDLDNKGPCSSREVRKVSSSPVNTVISHNELNGPLKSGIIVAGSNTRVVANLIRGPIRDLRFDAGIRLEGKHAIETAHVNGNRVLNAATALSLVKNLDGLKADDFGAKITNNEFTGYVVAVMTSATPHTAAVPGDPNYDLSTELSFNGRGNFWNTTCAIGLASNKVRKTDGSINCLIRDSHHLPSAIIGFPTPCPTLPHNCVEE